MVIAACGHNENDWIPTGRGPKAIYNVSFASPISLHYKREPVRMSRTYLLTFAMFAAAALPNFAAADDAKKADTNPSGTWSWTQDFGAGDVEHWLFLTAKGKELTGTFEMEGLDEPVKITDGKIEDGKFSFKLAVPFDGAEISSTVTGKTKGDKLTAVTAIDIDGAEQEFDIEAERNVRAKDVAGKWAMEVDVEGMYYESEWTIKADGKKLSAVFGMEGQEVDFKSIELKKNKLHADVTIPFGDAELDLSFSLMPKGNKITGDMEFSGDAGEGAGIVTGKREMAK